MNNQKDETKELFEWVKASDVIAPEGVILVLRINGVYCTGHKFAYGDGSFLVKDLNYPAVHPNNVEWLRPVTSPLPLIDLKSKKIYDWWDTFLHRVSLNQEPHPVATALSWIGANYEKQASIKPVVEDKDIELEKAAFNYAVNHSSAPDKETPDWIITDFKAGANWMEASLNNQRFEYKDIERMAEEMVSREEYENAVNEIGQLQEQLKEAEEEIRELNREINQRF